MDKKSVCDIIKFNCANEIAVENFKNGKMCDQSSNSRRRPGESWRHKDS